MAILLSPFGKGMALNLYNLKSSSPKDALYHFGWNWPSCSREEDFKILSMYFCYFVTIFQWKMVWPFIWTNLHSLHPRMLCAKFGWKWPSGPGKEDENMKSLQADGQTEGRQVIRKAYLSFQLRWGKNVTQIKYRALHFNHVCNSRCIWGVKNAMFCTYNSGRC